MAEPPLHVVLVSPEIPPNTGNIGRLCVGLGLRLHLVRPLGFDLSEKAVRRAGLDYWSSVDLVVHDDLDAFLAWSKGRRCHLFSARGAQVYTRCPWRPGDVLVFGRESVGLDPSWVEREGAYRLPMSGPIRSLNLGNAVSVVCYQAMQTVCPGLFDGGGPG